MTRFILSLLVVLMFQVFFITRLYAVPAVPYAALEEIKLEGIREQKDLIQDKTAVFFISHKSKREKTKPKPRVPKTPVIAESSNTSSSQGTDWDLKFKTYRSIAASA